MDWKALGKKIVGLGAPLVGTALAGPAGGTVGAMVANLFGADPEDPEDVAAKIEADPQAVFKVRQMQLNHRERLEELALEHARLETEQAVTQVREVNATMRVEAQAEHWPQWSWRPFWGFISGLSFLAVCVFVCVLGYRAIEGKDSNAIGMIPMVIGAFTTLFTVPGAILGISAWGRNKLKQSGVAEKLPDIGSST